MSLKKFLQTAHFLNLSNFLKLQNSDFIYRQLQTERSKLPVSLSGGVQPLKWVWLSRVTIPPNAFSPTLSDLEEKKKNEKKTVLLYFLKLANKPPCDTGQQNRHFLGGFCSTHRIRFSCKHSWCNTLCLEYQHQFKNYINIYIYLKLFLFCCK